LAQNAELTLESAVSKFGAKAKSKLQNPGASGQPEDQLRAPLEELLSELGELCSFRKGTVTAIGESSVSDLKTRPDYSVTVHKALVGFIEIKAPGKGADPRRFKDPHDREQWEKLRSLPNILYTDGNSFSLWRDGELIDSIVTLVGDIESSGAKLRAPAGFLPLIDNFFNWKPVPPRSAQELAHTTARLCRFLREEVTEQLSLKSEALTSLAADWRKLLFPDATDERFADGYAQAVTFGMLMARAKNIPLATGLHQVADELTKSSTLIGAALRLLTDSVETQQTLKTALGTLVRVLDVVDWPKISKGDLETWLYFYEDFLEVYDNQLRKQTGSYYTPPEVVSAMVALVDEGLRTSRFGLHLGLAAPSVTVVDPATGTGTFLLGILQKIADTVRADQGQGAVNGAISDSLKRLIAFELQLGPFAVAQLRILAEVVDLLKAPPTTPPRMFVTNTLGNPYDDEEWIPGILAALGKSRKDANKIKREEPITVIIGNPPYKEKAKGQGAWVENGSRNRKEPAPLLAWIPPTEWGLGAHAKHLRNLYVYFWRWATWKVFDHGPGQRAGMVCFITVAGFLNGPGFERMRDYLRRTCDDIWVIDCSPEGHQPEVNTRIFQAVQQPICIVLASRSAKNRRDANTPGRVLFQSLPSGHRETKFQALKALTLESPKWRECPSDWRSPFLPVSIGAWTSYPALEEFFIYHGSGVQPKRTWVISPDPESLIKRWQSLTSEQDADRKELLFHATLRDGEPADRHIRSIVRESIPGYGPNPTTLLDETGPCLTPVPYGFRSFNRQWIIPDARVITQPNAELWRSRSGRQVYLTALSRSSPTSGPAVSFTALVPDLDHYKGSFGGRVFPLWSDSDGTQSNFRPRLMSVLKNHYKVDVSPEDLMAYVAAIAGHPGFTVRFRNDLSTPGLHIPLAANPDLFKRAAELGKKVIWLHTFGERCTAKERPTEPPRLPPSRRPSIPAEGAIPNAPDDMPDHIAYDAPRKRLLIGRGYVDNVAPAVWHYEISGKQVLTQWFSYRKKNRERPIIGDRRPPSPLSEIQPDHWMPEYTTELINLINVLALLIDLEPEQSELLDKVLAGKVISREMLNAAHAFEKPAAKSKRKRSKPKGPGLFDSQKKAKT